MKNKCKVGIMVFSVMVGLSLATFAQAEGDKGMDDHVAPVEVAKAATVQQLVKAGAQEKAAEDKAKIMETKGQAQTDKAKTTAAQNEISTANTQINSTISSVNQEITNAGNTLSSMAKPKG